MPWEIIAGKIRVPHDDSFLFFGDFMYNETFINGIFEFTVTHNGENVLTIRVPGTQFSRVLAMRAVAQSMAEMAK